MDDLMNSLQNVLQDKDAMAQISELAKLLGGSDNAAPAPPAANTGTGDGGLSQLSSLLGGSTGNNSNDGIKGIDPQLLLKLGTVIQSANRKDDSINLLYALKPLLKEESRAKIDRLISIFRLLSLYPALKESGILGGDGLGLFK